MKEESGRRCIETSQKSLNILKSFRILFNRMSKFKNIAGDGKEENVFTVYTGKLWQILIILNDNCRTMIQPRTLQSFSINRTPSIKFN